MQKCPAIEVTTTHSAPAATVREPRIDDYLRRGVIAYEIAEKRWGVGMHNRQLQRRLLTGER